MIIVEYKCNNKECGHIDEKVFGINKRIPKWTRCFKCCNIARRLFNNNSKAIWKCKKGEATT